MEIAIYANKYNYSEKNNKPFKSFMVEVLKLVMIPII